MQLFVYFEFALFLEFVLFLKFRLNSAFTLHKGFLAINLKFVPPFSHFRHFLQFFDRLHFIRSEMGQL